MWDHLWSAVLGPVLARASGAVDFARAGAVVCDGARCFLAIADEGVGTTSAGDRWGGRRTGSVGRRSNGR